MAINFNNQNGIGTLDLSQFGLIQPQNTNMRTAGMIPEFMGGTSDEEDAAQNSLEQIQSLRQQENAINSMGEGAQYLKQDELKSIQNQIQNIKNQNKDSQEFKDIGGLTAFSNNIMTDANVDTPSTIIEDEQGNLIDTENIIQFGNEKFDSEPYEYTPNYLGANSPMLDEGNTTISSLSNYGYDPAFGQLQNHFYGDTSYPSSSGSITGYFDDALQTQQVPSLQRALGNERFAMAPELTSQPQELGYVEPATVPKEAIYQDRIRNNNLSNFSYEPKEEGILRGLQDKIGAGFNNLIDNPLTRGAGTAFNFLRGSVPGMLMSGLGALFNRDPNAPSYQTRSPDIDYSNLNTTNLNDFYDSNPDSDTFGTTRFDRATTAFGKSRALFGPNGIAATKAKMAKAKAAKAKAYKEKQAADAITAANNPYNPDGSRAAYNYAGRDNAQGTHTSTMSNAQAQANQDRGRGRYNQGGLASMFTRRR